MVREMDAASDTRLRDEIAAASETPKAKKQRIDKKMVAAPEKSEVSEKSQASDAFEESAQEGRAAPEKSGRPRRLRRLKSTWRRAT